VPEESYRNETKSPKITSRAPLTVRAVHIASVTPSAHSLLELKYRNEGDGRHARSVGLLTALLAREIGLSTCQIALLREAAALHDVGKMGIPGYILGRPGALTRAEFNQIKSHTWIGARILSRSQSAVLYVASRIALSHHERWDGMGYPQGLAGELIPLPARITAIADVFDALTHDRPYKNAWDLQKAIEAIEHESGRHFDPALIQAFLSLVRRKPCLQIKELIVALTQEIALSEHLNQTLTICMPNVPNSLSLDLSNQISRNHLAAGLSVGDITDYKSSNTVAGHPPENSYRS